MNREDFSYQPTIEEIGEYINRDLFNEFCLTIEKEYKAKAKIEFSKCSWEYGWNIKFKKLGKTLCTIYPRIGYFTVMVVVEQLPENCGEEIKRIYQETNEGNGQRWLMIDLEDSNIICSNVLKLIEERYNTIIRKK